MYAGKIVFSQLVDHLPMHSFRRCVERYHGHYKVQSFSCLDQYLCMAFAQLTYRESLRDIEACLRAQRAKLYHMGIRGHVSRATLADANEKRDWRIHADFAQALIGIARRLYVDDPFGVDLDNTVYALDATTIDLCLTLFPWAPFQRSKAAIFVVRGHVNFRFRRLYSHPIDKQTGLICDQTIVITGRRSATHYPDKLRRIKYRDAETENTLVFLTNNLTLPALTIARLYKSRWQVELFFKWIKQHLRIKRFSGNSENAVKTQVWIAVSVYVLIAIIKKRLGIDASLYTILQVLSVTVFEKTPLLHVLGEAEHTEESHTSYNQLNLFD